MKQYSNIFKALLATMALLISCSEPYDLNTGKSEVTYLAVECILNDVSFYRQQVYITQSIPYIGGEEDVDKLAVSGAKVSISDGEETVEFLEDEDGPAGTYYAPFGYCGQIGKTYTLSIDRTLDNGEVKHYESTTTMIEPGFVLDSLDYVNSFFVQDSTWTIAVYGHDKPQKSNFLIMTGLNDIMRPLSNSLFISDKYFGGSEIKGFPITVLTQSYTNMAKLGPVAKPIEVGDYFNVMIYTLQDDFYKYLQAYLSNTTMSSIPLLSTQPANLPTNIKGENAVGFFTATSAIIDYCVVYDYDKTKFNHVIYGE